MSGLPEVVASVASMDRLTVYSCGGSSGIARSKTARTAFPLGSGQRARRTAMVTLCEAARAGSKGKLPTAAAWTAPPWPVGSDPARIAEADFRRRDPLTGFTAAFSSRAEKKLWRFSLGILSNRDFLSRYPHSPRLTWHREAHQMWVSRFHPVARLGGEDGKPVSCTPTRQIRRCPRNCKQ